MSNDVKLQVLQTGGKIGSGLGISMYNVFDSRQN